MDITITTKNLCRVYEATNGQEAIKLFFDDVRAGKVPLDELGFIGSWTDGKESYPFRTGPALFKCGLITRQQIEASFERAEIAFTPVEIEAMADADAWMVRHDEWPELVGVSHEQ
jgi:hypothetical protein